eukprot:gene6561-9018_t
MKRLYKIGSEKHDVGKVIFSWHPEGNFLASAGRNGIIHITDRHGEIIDEIPMASSAPILALEWDKDGEYLAILQDGNGLVPLWNLSNRRVTQLETNLKDPTFLAWSKIGPQLAIGTAKGSVLIYNKSRKNKVPIVGKHSKKITCGVWSKGFANKLVLGSDDRTLSISNENGDTLIHTELRNIPLQTHFTKSKFMNGTMLSSSSNNDDDIVSANLNGKSLLLYNILDDKIDPLELTFGPRQTGPGCKYGDIVEHFWFEEGLMLIGFSGGYLLTVSTNPKELGQEKLCEKFHPTALYTFSYNPFSKKTATAGDDGVHIIDTRDYSESKRDFISVEDLEDGRVNHVSWSPDGQILTVATTAGNVYNFLAKMSVLNATYKSNVAYLSSLREVSIVDVGRRIKPIDVTVKLEPSLIALGASHIAAGMNNRVYYHRISDNNNNQQTVNEQEYIGVVKEVQLNQNFAAILTDSKAMIHPIESNPSNANNQIKTFPNREEGLYSKVTCIALTDDFLFYGTEAGTVEVFFLGEWCLLSGLELRLNNPIKKLYPNSNGTKIVVIDSINQSFLYNPVTGGGVNQSITPFTSVPLNIVSVLWDLVEKNIIMFFDGKSIHSFIFVQTSIKGSLLIKLGPVSVSADGGVEFTPDKIEVTPGFFPLVSIGGTITCQTGGGALTSFKHVYFDLLDELRPSKIDENGISGPSGGGTVRNRSDNGKKDKKVLSNKFCQAIALLKLESAWEVALDLDRRQFWLALSGKAMELMNIELALRVYRQLGDAGMVMALQECMHIEDKNLLAGQISLLFSDYQRAQDLFLASSRPTAALDMRRDLLQWDQALKLAQILSANQIPDICVQYGQQLEFRGDYDAALKMFQSAVEEKDGDGNNICSELLYNQAMMGISRCTLRLGNIRHGIRLANQIADKQLFIDCGDILEQQKQYSDAASMYMSALQYENAARIYTKYLLKDKQRIQEAVSIMDKVDNDNLNSDFAKACEAAGRYEDAAKAYERAKDLDKVVELRLKYLDQVQQAFDLVRKTASSQGAQYVADYCQSTNDFRGAIEFLLIANKSDEAFQLAQSQSIVEVYTSMLGENIGTEDAIRVAHYFEKNQDFGRAGHFYSRCGQYKRALELFMKCGDREINSAIEVVGKSQNESLTHQLIDFLMGEKDGVPKDSSYIYRLYLALKKYEDAAKTALIIAREEQDLGNYSSARGIIFETIRHLEDANIKVSLHLRQSFVLLHSYMLIKNLVRHNDHMGAARLLLRVAQNISKFPKHVVKILTSTVIECQRAGLKSSSYEYAVMLMRPEYRSLIDVNLKRKIEAIVRRRANVSEDVIEDMSECPISSQLIPVSQLECPTTRDSIPMCVVTGKHMVLDDWCICPNSKAPAIFSEYMKYIDEEIQLLMIAQAESTGQGQDGLKDSINESKSESKSNSPNNRTVGYVSTTLLQALDPIMNKPVSKQDLVLLSREEALKYIAKYNNVVEKKENNGNEQDVDNKNSSNVNENGAMQGIGMNDESGRFSNGNNENENGSNNINPMRGMTNNNSKTGSEARNGSNGNNRGQRRVRNKRA